MKGPRDKTDFYVGLISGFLLLNMSGGMFYFSSNLINQIISIVIGFFSLFSFCFAYGGWKGWK